MHKTSTLFRNNRESLIAFIGAFHSGAPVSALVGKVVKVMYQNSTYVAHSGTIVNAAPWFGGYRMAVSNENGIFTVDTTLRNMPGYSMVSIDGQAWEPSKEIEKAERARHTNGQNSKAYRKLLKIFSMASEGDLIYRGIYDAKTNDLNGAWWEVLSVVRKVRRSGTVLQLQNSDNPKEIIECNAAHFADANPNSSYGYQIGYNV